MSTQTKHKSNQIFSFKRFWRYSQAMFAEKQRSFMWFFAVIAMIYCLVLLMHLSTTTHYYWYAQATFYYAGLFTTGFVFSARYFSNFAKKDSALIALMLPVSLFEKWLLAVITTLIIYPVIYTLIYVVMTYPTILLTNVSSGFEGDPEDLALFLPFASQTVSQYFNQLPLWLFYQAMCAYTIMASVFFKSLPLLKTFVLAFCLFLFFILMSININPNGDLLFYYFGNAFESETKILSTQILLANVLFWLVTPLLLWVASFYALQERELL